MSGIFKAYDVRGLYPDQIDEEMARQIGLSFHNVLDEADRPPGSEVVVSRDMRSHSVPLSAALIDGLRSSGLDVCFIGLATTPMNYFAIGSLQAAGGIQVTASHNPARYNGLKFSLRGARPVSGDHGIPLMERKVTTGDLPTADNSGGLREAEIFDSYGQHVLSFLENKDGMQRLKVAVDAANGMGTLYLPLLEAMGIDLEPLYFELDGTFPNHEANPLKMENLRDVGELVRSSGADLGIAFDGDGDRAAFLDERGEPIGSDIMTALISGELLARQPGKHVLYDLRSSRAVAEYIEECGGIPVRERVGHSFMKATLRQKDGIFGGELAGHYYFRDNYFADSALMAVVEVLNLLRTRNLPMSAVAAPLLRYAKSPEINFEVEDKQGKMDELGQRFADGKTDYLDGITIQYDDWWFNVRPSNTEPYLRLVLEARDAEQLARRTDELIGLLGTPAD